MALLQYTTTADEDAAIAWATARGNASRAAQGLPTKTAAEYFADLVRSALASYATQRAEADAAKVADAYKAADAAKQASVKTTLGV